uniref:NUDIX hydrolase n=1 Tax=uncultured Thalassospira sp. TaxID=404382 RepID=UPI0025990CEF
MKFCSECGQGVTARVPDGDTRSRFVCDHCQTIHYQNPRIVAGCLAVHGQQVLLCRRAIESRRGFWTLPAGFMENNETIAEGAAREAREEACAEVETNALIGVYNVA